DAGGAFEHFIQQLWAFVGQDARGGRRGYARAGRDDVFEKKFGSVFGAAADDAALRVTSVRLVRIAGAGDDGDLPVAITGKLKRSRGARYPATDDQDLNSVHCGPRI